MPGIPFSLHTEFSLVYLLTSLNIAPQFSFGPSKAPHFLSEAYPKTHRPETLTVFLFPTTFFFFLPQSPGDPNFHLILLVGINISSLPTDRCAFLVSGIVPQFFPPPPETKFLSTSFSLHCFPPPQRARAIFFLFEDHFSPTGFLNTYASFSPPSLSLSCRSHFCFKFRLLTILLLSPHPVAFFLLYIPLPRAWLSPRFFPVFLPRFAPEAEGAVSPFTTLLRVLCFFLWETGALVLFLWIALTRI